jgi:hypothetical protein
MANKSYFLAGLGASQDVKSDNRTVRVVDDSGEEIVTKAGYLVNIGSLSQSSIYGDNFYNSDSYQAKLATSAMNAPRMIAAIDPQIGDVLTGSDGREYKNGRFVVGQDVPKGDVKATILHLFDEPWFGVSNFTAAPTVDQYATLGETAGLLTPAASLPESGFAVQILPSDGTVDHITAGFEVIPRVHTRVVQL